MANYDLNKIAIAAILGIVVIVIIVGLKTSGQTAQFTAACVDADADGFAENCAPRDCNDNNNKIFPGAQEVCFDSEDNNCNGEANENCPYCFGNAKACSEIKFRVLCNRQAGCDWSFEDYGKCKGIVKQCYEITQEANCDLQDTCTWYPVCNDFDKDGFYKEGCGKLPDCDDNENLTYPGAQEICDYKDNDCDGIADNVYYCPRIKTGPEGLAGRTVSS